MADSIAGGSDVDQFDLNQKYRKKHAVQQSKLRPAITTVQYPIVYDDKYNIGFFGFEKIHPFDSKKWGRIYQHLQVAGLLTKETIVKPIEATHEDLLVVHSEKYLNSLSWSANVAMIMEVPPVALLPNFIVQRKALSRFRLHTGGSIMAAQLALERGWAINLGGGFHHCSADHGGGFCAYADISLAIQFLFHLNSIQRAMIVDLDAHQGNGHEIDFLGDDRVFIFDMYNARIYPNDFEAKKAISYEVPLPSHCGDETFLKLLREGLETSVQKFSPDIIVYNAGTDCLEGDPLGNLAITREGIIERDAIVFKFAQERHIAIMMVTSGGYQMSNARIIADSILNLHSLGLITDPPGKTS